MLIKKMLFGYYETQCLYVITELKIADYLQSTPKSIAELASLAEVNKDKLYRIMRFMAAKGVFNELPDQVFQLNRESEVLVSTSVDNLNHFIQLHAEYFYNSATKFMDCIKSDNTAFELKFGESATEHFKNNKSIGELYNLAMKENSELYGKLIAKTYDFSKYKTIIDVGGGYGSLLVSILLQNKDAIGINFDLPALQEAAEKYFKDNEVASRCQYVGGDFLKSIPHGGDLYIMKAILHGKNDVVAIEVLNKCKEVLLENSKLLIIERIICRDAKNSIEACINDINMLNVTSGHVRTQTEFERLFHNAGYLIQQIYPVDDNLSIIEITLKY